MFPPTNPRTPAQLSLRLVSARIARNWSCVVVVVWTQVLTPARLRPRALGLLRAVARAAFGTAVSIFYMPASFSRRLWPLPLCRRARAPPGLLTLPLSADASAANRLGFLPSRAQRKQSKNRGTGAHTSKCADFSIPLHFSLDISPHPSLHLSENTYTPLTKGTYATQCNFPHD